MRICEASVCIFTVCIQIAMCALTIACGIAWAAQYEVYRNLCFMPKTKSLVGNSMNYPSEVSRIRFWSVENGKVEDVMQYSREEEPTSIDVNPDGKSMVVAFLNFPTIGEKNGHASVATYSLIEKKWLWRIDWPTKSDVPREVRYSPDGLKVIVVGYKNVLLYDAKTGNKVDEILEPLKDYPNLDLSIRGTILSPSTRYLVVWQEKSSSGHLSSFLQGLKANKWVTVWDLHTRKQIARWEKPQYKHSWATFTQDEKSILFGTEGRLELWSIERQEMIRAWMLPDFRLVDYLKFSDDYRYLAIHGLGRNFSVVIWDYVEGKEIHRFDNIGYSGGTHGQFPMIFSHKGDFLAFAGGDQMCLYSTKNWKEVWCYSGK